MILCDGLPLMLTTGAHAACVVLALRTIKPIEAGLGAAPPL